MAHKCAVFVATVNKTPDLFGQEGHEYQISDTILVIVSNLLATNVFGGFL